MGRMRMVATLVFFSICLVVATEAIADEYAITSTPAFEYGSAVAFDGTNFLVGIQEQGENSPVSVQFVTRDGVPLGERIATGRTGGMPAVLFDGSNYLVAWSDDENWEIYRMIVSPSGGVLAAPSPITSDGFYKDLPYAPFNVALGGENAAIVWSAWPGSDPTVYARIVAKDGSTSGEVIQVSAGPADYPSVAFDGTNYLVVFVMNETVYGQRVSPAGALLGSVFTIDDSGDWSYMPTSVIFDGSRYVVSYWDEDPSLTGWRSYIRFVSPQGVVSQDRLMLFDGEMYSGGYVAAFHDGHYLATLSDAPSDGQPSVRVRFFDRDFKPTGDWSTLFTTLGGSPILGPGVAYDGFGYFIVTTKALYDDEGMIRDIDVVGASLARIFLLPGWNLVSLPLQSPDASVEAVLGGALDKCLVIWSYYDGIWRYYNPADPGGSLLLQLEAGRGYWIRMAEGRSIEVAGNPAPRSLALSPGWNLVGYNDRWPKASEAALSNIEGTCTVAWAYDEQTWRFYSPGRESNTLSSFSPGLGYWIRTTDAATWTLP